MLYNMVRSGQGVIFYHQLIKDVARNNIFVNYGCSFYHRIIMELAQTRHVDMPPSELFASVKALYGLVIPLSNYEVAVNALF